jgi:hypothetical protein
MSFRLQFASHASSVLSGIRVSGALGVAVLATGCFSDPAPTGSPGSQSNSSSSAVSGPQGCTIPAGAPAPVFAPGGYYTNGAQVCTADGKPHVFHGVDRPSFEWNPMGQGISGPDFGAMADWHANVVRIAMNQDFWLSTAALHDPGYAGNIDAAVQAAEAVGLDVILDLHWSDRGDLTLTQAGGTFPSNPMQYVPSDTAGYSVQQPMADQNSVQFWSEVAATYKNDGHVIFELYNEPNGITWDIWLNGGMLKDYQAAGMQQLHDAVRGAGAENLIIAGGINWAFDLSGVASHRIQGHNVMYASHPYKQNDTQSQWPNSFGYLAQQNIAPVIITEFGDNRANVCTGDWDQAVINYAAPLQISWTAWAWFAGDPCTFPSLISSPTRHTPTVQGMVVQAALANDPKPVPWKDAGAADDSGAEDASTDATATDATLLDAADEGDAATLDAATLDASDAATSDPDASDASTD